ncbi:hypothetical protein FRC08_012762 [Ceratobasidium sp. 394]|nr:hypothetical protein FRC08_012762 [Ceratobasidium sp. 394]
MPLTQQQRERADALYAKYGKMPPRNEIEGLARDMGVKESMVKDHLKHVQCWSGVATHQHIQDSSAQVSDNTASSFQCFPESPSDLVLLGDPDIVMIEVQYNTSINLKHKPTIHDTMTLLSNVPAADFQPPIVATMGLGEGMANLAYVMA